MFTTPSVPSDVVSVRADNARTKFRPQVIITYCLRGLANGKVLFFPSSKWAKGGHDLCFRPHDKSSARGQ